jgi:Tol biopolymer transport system component
MAVLTAFAVLAVGCQETQGGQGDSSTPRSGIVFASKRTGDFEIFLAAGRGAENLSRTPPGLGTEADDQQPAWSPDGRLIAFTSSRDHRGDGNEAWDVYVMAANGDDVRRLTRNNGPDMRPGWLPGGRVVYSSCRIGFTDCRLVAVDPTGADRETLAELGTFVLDATPSPNGKRIAFTRQLRAGPAQVCVGSVGGAARCLGDGGEPAWSPNGRRLAFVSARAHNGRCLFHDCFGFAPELYIVNADGTHVRRLTSTTG